MREIFEISAAILGSLGVGVLIIGAFTKWLGDLWAKRLIQNEKKKLDEEIESYKIKLKKSEFIFQKEFEAASELVALIRSFLPTYSYPQMDWGDACDRIALDFDNIELKLHSYLSKHGAVLKENVVELISSCIAISGENKSEITSPDDVPRIINDAANNLYEKLKKAEKEVLQQVHSQSSN
jgi:hypothetical protein